MSRYVTRTEEGRSSFILLIGKPTGKRLLGMPRHEWKDIIRMDVKLIVYAKLD